MARIFKSVTTVKIPTGATRLLVGGVAFVTWSGRGGVVRQCKVCPKDPEKCRLESTRWYLEYVDERGRTTTCTAFADRKASEKLLAKVRKLLNRIEAGDASAAFELPGAKSLGALLELWRSEMAGRGCAKEHIKTSVARVAKIIEMSSAGRVADLTTIKVRAVLDLLRGAKDRPLSAQTVNHYATSCHAFIHWCQERGYVDADPMRDYRPLECESRRTFERRALTAEEIKRLLDATAETFQPQCPLDGPCRAALYATAIYTGLRVGELASLTAGSFKLQGASPSVAVHGSATKNRKGRVQPIHPEAATFLRRWLESAPTDGPCWPGYRWRTGKAAEMLRRDLEAAGIERDGPAGRLDFHALRTTFGTMLAQAGVPIQHARDLMGHSDINLTARHYTRLVAADLAAQVARLPFGGGEKSDNV